MTLGLGCALVSGCVLFVLVVWRIVSSGTIDGGPALRCSEGSCTEALVLESSFYRRTKAYEPFHRVKWWRCNSGHAWTSVEGKLCERFDRDARRDSQELTAATRPDKVRSTPQGQQPDLLSSESAGSNGAASARPSIPGQLNQVGDAA